MKLTKDNAVLGETYHAIFDNDNRQYKTTLIGISKPENDTRRQLVFGFRLGETRPSCSYGSYAATGTYRKDGRFNWIGQTDDGYEFDQIANVNSVSIVESETKHSLPPPSGPMEFILAHDIQVGDIIVASVAHGWIRYAVVEDVEESETCDGEGSMRIIGNTYGDSPEGFKRSFELNRNHKVLLINRT